MDPGMEPTCTHCGSDNVLPFEDEEPQKSDPTLFLVLLSAFLVITGYFLFMITSYLYFPLVVFAAIIVTTRLVNKRERQQKIVKHVEKNYVCLDCSQFFRK